MIHGPTTVLVVDDTPENIDVLAGVLRDDYQVKAATRGIKALEIAGGESPPDLILLDIMMPEMDGFEVCERLKADPRTRHIPVIFVTAKIEVADEVKGLALGAVDYISKPISPPIVLSRVRTHLALQDQNRELERKVRERTAELDMSRLQVIHCLARAASYRDRSDKGRALRISHYSRLIGEVAGLSSADVSLLGNAALLCDLGKIGLSDAVLKQAGSGEKEPAIVEAKAKLGTAILGNDSSELLGMARQVVQTYRERWDGSGYPRGLTENAIPLAGRIVGIADMLDTLTSEHEGTEAYTVDEALVQLEATAGAHFDPRLVRLLAPLAPEFANIQNAFSD